MDPGTQNGTVPGRVKNHRTLTILENFIDVLATQLPRGPDASVACGPHNPRPKDCTGLGDLTPSNHILILS